MSTEWETNAIATGPKPVMLTLENMSPEALGEQLIQAKSQGCIAVVVDMVGTEDCAVISPEHLGMLKVACAEKRMLLIIDETMTAIRCGAPFAFQRIEFAEVERDKMPDLVIFGKGMGVSGIAIGFGGATIKHLRYTSEKDRLQTILYWRALVSRPVRIPILIEALGILRTAQRNNWIERSVVIGEAIRNVVHDFEASGEAPKASIRGLGSMLAVQKGTSIRFGIMSAIRRRSPWSRWLPKLDSSSNDYKALRRHVFGQESRVHRRQLAEEADRHGTIPLWCFICGIEATSKEWCRTCFLAYCNHEVCTEAFGRHACV